MQLLKNSSIASFAVPVAPPKIGLGTKLMNGFNAFNAITMPLFLAPLFVPDATTRLQAKMQQQQLKNPWLAKSMQTAQDAAQNAITTSKTVSNNGVMTANPVANRVIPDGLTKNSLLQ